MMADKRLIDANALINDIEGWRNRIGDTMNLSDAIIKNVLSSVMDGINESETIDAVPVVRCKDCRRRGKRGQCPLVHLVIALDGLKDIIDYSDDSGFCYYGEKEKDSNDA